MAFLILFVVGVLAQFEYKTKNVNYGGYKDDYGYGGYGGHGDYGYGSFKGGYGDYGYGGYGDVKGGYGYGGYGYGYGGYEGGEGGYEGGFGGEGGYPGGEGGEGGEGEEGGPPGEGPPDDQQPPEGPETSDRYFLSPPSTAEQGSQFCASRGATPAAITSDTITTASSQVPSLAFIESWNTDSYGEACIALYAGGAIAVPAGGCNEVIPTLCESGQSQ